MNQLKIGTFLIVLENFSSGLLVGLSIGCK